MPEKNLTLTVIGSAASWTREPGRASSCYLLQLDGQGLVLDLGQGAFSELAARRDPDGLRAILVSHLHPDHGIDLIPLRHYLRYGCEPPGLVELHAPSGLRDRFDTLAGERDFLADLPGEPLAPGTLELPPFAVTVAAVTHAEPSFAFRVAPLVRADAAGLVYSGDCGRADDVVALIRAGDTLLSEAYFGPGPQVQGPEHLNAHEAARAAR